jgi:hypothetical protein
MYVQQSSACDMPNSETPITAAQIARQDSFVARIGKKFTDGNAAMAGVVGMLTPPVPVGACDDFTSSLSMSNITPFPWPIPGPAGAGPGPAAPPTAAVLGPGSIPAPGAIAPAVAAAGPLTQVSPGWMWANPGGGSTYPWGATQLAASRLIPPWACAGKGAPGGMLPGGLPGTPTEWAWGLGAVALGLLLLAGGGRGKGRH